MKSLRENPFAIAKQMDKQQEEPMKIETLHEEQLEEAFINLRELATKGAVLLDDFKHVKKGQLVDFYQQSNGDKKQGKVSRIGKDEVTIKNLDTKKIEKFKMVPERKAEIMLK